MKKLIMVAVLIVFGLSANADANTNYSNRVDGYFYTSLSPYGTWIEIGYGTPVWRPTIVRKTWSPYYQGEWVYTDYGWYWNSYEPFGEIVYHMEGGTMMIIMVGFGFLTMNGHLPGLIGDMMMIISAGLLYHLMLCFQ